MFITHILPQPLLFNMDHIILTPSMWTVSLLLVLSVVFVAVVQLQVVSNTVTLWIAAYQVFLSLIIFQSFLKFMSIE